MFDAVTNSIRPFGIFSPEHLAQFEKQLTILTVQKKDLILKVGKTCKAFYFVIEGSCIHFYPASDGIDHIVNLYTENYWMTDHQSLTTQKPSTSFIQAFEDCTLAILDIHALHYLIQLSPEFFKIGKLFDVVKYTDMATAFQTPEEKYLNLLQKRPELIQKFPLKYLASYLQIVPETLSRIRKRMQ